MARVIKQVENGQIIDHIEIGYLTDTGRKRDHNEDNLYVFSPHTNFEQRGMLFAVADGMGGHAGGEFASRIAVDTLGKYYTSENDNKSFLVSLENCITEANSLIYSQAQSSPVLRGMGTTLTTAIVDNSSLNIGQVGDSRVYLVRNGQLQQLTNVHSLVAEQIRQGIITEAEASSHPAKNIITRALGTKAKVEIDFYTFELEADDRVLLCSDGLHGYVKDERTLELVVQSESPMDAVRKLIAQANENGGPDNITCILIHLRPVKPFWKRLLGI
jgi:protein phosphatase